MGGGIGQSIPPGYTNTHIQEFIRGNIAFVACKLPPDSQPPPTVQFYVNGTAVGNARKFLPCLFVLRMDQYGE